jgi:hypothetical protein
MKPATIRGNRRRLIMDNRTTAAGQSHQWIAIERPVIDAKQQNYFHSRPGNEFAASVVGLTRTCSEISAHG